MLASTTGLPVITLALIGLGAGVVGGLLGVGGALVIIPALLIVLPEHFGPGSMHLYKLAALVTAAALSTLAARQHARAGATVPPIYRAMVAGAIVGVVGGVALSSLFSGESTHVLRKAFGVFMVAVVAIQVPREVRRTSAGTSLRDRSPTTGRWWVYASLVGLPSGLLSGFLGIGGGIWAVPSQYYLLGVRLHNAIANSGTMIVTVASVAALLQWFLVAQMDDVRAADGWLLVLFIAPGAMVGGWFGGALAHRLPVRRLRLALYALLAVAGVRLAFF
jgi:uncharacterized membrane protein YfcA